MINFYFLIKKRLLCLKTNTSSLSKKITTKDCYKILRTKKGFFISDTVIN